MDVFNLEELKAQNLTIINEPVVENNILKILEEYNLSLADLSKLTGISRQAINYIIKNRMTPGIDFCLKVAYVLNLPVSELFYLKEDAWINKDNVKYLDVSKKCIVDKKTVTEGCDYFDLINETFLSTAQYQAMQKEFVSANLSERLSSYLETNVSESQKSLNSRAINSLKDEFNKRYVKSYLKVGEQFVPKQVSKSRS